MDWRYLARRAVTNLVGILVFLSTLGAIVLIGPAMLGGEFTYLPYSLLLLLPLVLYLLTSTIRNPA